MTSRQYHRSMSVFRYIPVGAFALMFAHVILLNFGIDYPIAEIITIIAGFYIAHQFSIIFQFCLIHRLCIYYALVVMACIWLRRFPAGESGIFGCYICHARITMLVIGSILFALLVLKEVHTIRHLCQHRTKKVA